MKTTRMAKKSNNNGRNVLRIAWNIRRIHMPLSKNGWTRTKPYG
jgi:hypothetical protein